MNFPEINDLSNPDKRVFFNMHGNRGLNISKRMNEGNLFKQDEGREILLDNAKLIMSKTDSHGVIEFANDYFIEISGYNEYELMGQPHNIIRHPDMPQIIFKILWGRLNKGNNIYALVKNLTKDGNYYWVLTSFETKYDDAGLIKSHYSYRKAAPRHAIFKIERLYKTLRLIEKQQGLNVSEKYLNGLLEEHKMSYDSFILNILGVEENTILDYFNQNQKHEKKKKSLFNRIFNKNK